MHYSILSLLLLLFAVASRWRCDAARKVKLANVGTVLTRSSLSDKDVADMTAALRTKIAMSTLAHSRRSASEPDRSGTSYRMSLVEGDPRHVKVIHADQQYQGMHVLGGRVIEQQTAGYTTHVLDKATGRPTGEAMRVPPASDHFGQIIDGVENDIPLSEIKKVDLNPLKALQQLKKQYKRVNFEEAETVVYIDEKDNDKAKIGYKLRLFTSKQKGNKPTMPVHLIDAKSGKTVRQWDDYETVSPHIEHMACRAKRQAVGGGDSGATVDDEGAGPGGNEKIGKHVFGGDQRHFTVTVYRNGTCEMQTSHVRVVNLEQTSARTTRFDPWTFECHEGNNEQPINGGYSPLNDAMYQGSRVYDMYQKWYSSAPIKREDGGAMQLLLQVHYGTNREEASWIDNTVIFGDGANSMHPLVALDITSHEVAHWITSQTSKLEYTGQSGGLNEAFSDMAGKAAERFENGKGNVNWAVGHDITKGKQPLRYMDQPNEAALTKGNIGHVKQYTWSTSVHQSSGIFNKAFYCMSQKFKNDVWDAFDIFYMANTRYWHSETDLVEAAELALLTVDDLKMGKHLPWGYKWIQYEDMQACFNEVGIECSRGAKKWVCEAPLLDE